MNHHFGYDHTAPKKPVNLSVNSDLLHQAKTRRINLSRTFEEAIRNKLKTILEEQWLAEHQQAIAAYNRHITKDGIFAADKRRF